MAHFRHSGGLSSRQTGQFDTISERHPPLKTNQTQSPLYFETASVAIPKGWANDQRLEEMNCEKYQDLLSEFIDGSLTPEEHQRVETHLSECVACAEVRGDLAAIVITGRDCRAEYDPVPNERALWVRISNAIESQSPAAAPAKGSAKASWWTDAMSRRWQISLPQLAASIVAIAIVVALGTAIGVRRFQDQNLPGAPAASAPTASTASSLEQRFRQQQQTIAYWNQRVELNKARWSQQMRDTFDRNMSVIDAAVSDSMRELTKNPHDEVSEEVLNSALNDKVQLLREFAEL